MSARMQVPLSQRRHTNIAVVRYSKNGVKLEIACYKNKVISYRSGTEDRLDEVLQVDRIFSNVARGYVAAEKDIQAVFGRDMSEQDAIKYMLEHGELQVAQQERTHEVDEMFKDIALIISQKCVNTKTQRPFPAQVIEQALRSIGAGVKLDQPVKKQALGLIHQLIESQVIPIARANMKLRCLAKTEAGRDAIVTWCAARGSDAEVVEVKAPNQDENKTAMYSVLIVAQPHLFRDLDTFVKENLPAGSTVHMVEQAVTAESTATGADMVQLTAGTQDSSAPAATTTAEPNVVVADSSSMAASSEPDTRAAASAKKKKSKRKQKGAALGAESGSDDEDGDCDGDGDITITKSGHHDDDDEDDEDDDEDDRRKNKKNKKQARKAKKDAVAAVTAKAEADEAQKSNKGKSKKKKKGGRRGGDDDSEDDVIGADARGADELLANLKRLGIAEGESEKSHESDSDDESEDTDFAPRKSRRGKKH